ncbi:MULTISPECIES: HAD hydrolase-like protein [unclassified Staphylococcus]|uniref:HAD family hydrolase n=1 Tax=unclassified Staphylococcus TaxID=91994 RepID=UPI0021D122A4|nr:MULTISPECIES: HAD hydrolase-like protein [unclassified Staphylococcus]UXR79131.1 HAD hydrolase-like protein [Staphylococcus sp. IVB6227]UXR81772.1 HAD hydrolase-like protein [Staphylococcus sp. IVB6214]
MTKAVLFDVDGVFLDESRCFDVSALTVYELLYDKAYLNLKEGIALDALTESEIMTIRNELFENDLILHRLKSLGINSNWDMLFIVFSVHLIDLLKSLPEAEKLSFLDESTFSETSIKALQSHIKSSHIDYALPLDFLNHLTEGKEQIYEGLKAYAANILQTDKVALFDINSPLWQLAQELYQEWYLGTKLYEEVEKKEAKTNYKKGYIYDEVVLAPIDGIRSLLQDLKEAGYLIAIATGRTRVETLIPFEALGLLSYFDDSHIVTASEVIQAEKQYPELKPLGKPNPFSYVATYDGNDTSKYHDYATNQVNRLHHHEVTIVGDSLADLLSAQKVNARFIGTLTGLKGTEAAEELDSKGADELVNHVLEVRQYLL